MANFHSSIYQRPASSLPPRGAVLLFHGLTSSPREWLECGNQLCADGFVVGAPQLAGHQGDFEEFRQTSSVDWLADVERAFEQLRAQTDGLPLFVGGVSFGALLACYLASQYPREVAGLILLSPSLRLRSYSREILLAALSHLPDVMLNLLPVKQKQTRSADTFAVPQEAYPCYPIGAVVRYYQIREQVKKQLNQIIVPMVIFQDPNDHLLAENAAKILQKKASNSVSVIHYIPNGEHELTLGHQREEVFSIIRRFVKDVLGG